MLQKFILGEARANTCPDQEEVALDRPYTADGVIACHSAGSGVEPARKEEKKAPEADLETKRHGRAQNVARSIFCDRILLKCVQSSSSNEISSTCCCVSKESDRATFSTERKSA